MEVSTSTGLMRLLFLLFWLQLYHSSPSFAQSTICLRPKIEDSIIVDEDQCPLGYENEFPAVVFATRGVLEVNAMDLERALQLLETQESMHASVLVYARWCPFSRALVPVFDSLASSFPAINHFAVEEAAFQPSAYSYYGVHSFPVLFFHNKTNKVRYRGSRTFEAINTFYRECSGFQPAVHHHESADGLKISRRVELGLSARVLEERKWQDELYLILSIIFLVSRVLFYLLPRAMNVVKQHWAEKVLFWKAHRSLLRRVVLGNFEQKGDMKTSNKSINGKGPKTGFAQETGKVLLSMPGWPSSSLASVSLVEGSSSKIGAKEDVHDNGHVSKNYMRG